MGGMPSRGEWYSMRLMLLWREELRWGSHTGWRQFSARRELSFLNTGASLKPAPMPSWWMPVVCMQAWQPCSSRRSEYRSVRCS